MLLSFTLSMPSNNSWNDKWSGEGNLYARVVNVGNTLKARAKADELLGKGYFHYNFGDGWAAAVMVKRVDGKEARRIRKETKGFCGYDWMIESIRSKGRIEA